MRLNTSPKPSQGERGAELIWVMPCKVAARASNNGFWKRGSAFLATSSALARCAWLICVASAMRALDARLCTGDAWCMQLYCCNIGGAIAVYPEYLSCLTVCSRCFVFALCAVLYAAYTR